MIITKIRIIKQETAFQHITKNEGNIEQAISGMCEERLIRTKVYLD